jgi:hypothetical protein
VTDIYSAPINAFLQRLIPDPESESLAARSVVFSILYHTDRSASSSKCRGEKPLLCHEGESEDFQAQANSSLDAAESSDRIDLSKDHDGE